jgi:dipeptidase E
MQGKIVLAGGGNAQDSLPLDQIFASWLRPEQKLLYLPIALRGVRPFSECLQWVRNTFAPLNLNTIEMWSDLSQHQASELSDFAAVYIGGGNTYALLEQCLESGFHRHLVEYVMSGGIIYGGSAGAAILGKDIRTVQHLDTNTVGLAETRGLNLAQDHAVWVHYRPQDDSMIFEAQRQHGNPILAISERAGVIVELSGVSSAGFEPAYRFDVRGKHTLPLRAL